MMHQRSLQNGFRIVVSDLRYNKNLRVGVIAKDQNHEETEDVTRSWTIGVLCIDWTRRHCRSRSVRPLDAGKCDILIISKIESI